MDIEQTIKRISTGSSDAFKALYTDQQPIMLRYAAGLLAGDRDAAMDAVDEAFMEIWRHADRYSGNGSAQGWIRHIVRNKAIDWLRKQRERPLKSEAEQAVFENHADDADTPAQAAEKHSTANELRAALTRLSIDHREVVWLCYFEEKSLSEIAALVGCPENTVKTRLFHARKQLAGILGGAHS